MKQINIDLSPLNNVPEGFDLQEFERQYIEMICLALIPTKPRLSELKLSELAKILNNDKVAK